MTERTSTETGTRPRRHTRDLAANFADEVESRAKRALDGISRPDGSTTSRAATRPNGRYWAKIGRPTSHLPGDCTTAWVRSGIHELVGSDGRGRQVPQVTGSTRVASDASLELPDD